MQKGKSKSRAVIITILVVLSVLITSVFSYIYIAKKNLPAQTSAESSSPFDVTPLIVAKLQQLVLQGSDSLYKLTIRKLKPDILSSQVQAFGVSLVPDSAVLLKLDKARRAPDDVFTFSFDTLRITGVNIIDFLHKKDIRLDTIFLSSPNIRVAHTDRPYNAAIRKRDSSLTLYQKLTRQFNSLSVGAIVAKEGNLVNTRLSGQKTTTELRHISAQLTDIRIDSLTQYDTGRFLFSKAASFTCHDYISSTADSLYVFKISSVSVSAHQHRMEIKGLALQPRGGNAAFEGKLKTRNDMFTVRFPDITIADVDWWALLNRQRFYAGELTLTNGLVKDYFDRSLPSSGKPTRKDNYPQQMLQQVPFPVFIRQVTVNGFTVAYEEFNPAAHRSGTLSFNNISGTINNITNEEARIQKAPQATCSLNAQFMDKVPVSAAFSFDLAKARGGAFSARFRMGTMPNTLLNPIAEPMGMYTPKSGTVDEATVAVAGDNYKATTNITLRYHDLRMFPLKETDDGHAKKQGITGFLANTFAIKDANPSGNSKEPRSLTVPVERDKQGGSFFNFLWQSVLSGIVKTIGLPKKFAEQ